MFIFTKQPTKWLAPERYTEAARLDAADWLLNLLFRRWLQWWPAEWAEAIVQREPVLRRTNEALRMKLSLAAAEPIASAAHAFHGGFLELMRDPPMVRGGVEPVTVQEFYVFERRLPEEVRTFAAVAPSRTRRTESDPDAYFGRFDHAFDPPMTGRFVRVDLSLPDRVIAADLHAFLKRERAELAALPRKPPPGMAASLARIGTFEDRVRAASKMKTRSLATMAKVRLLPYLDLVRWSGQADRRLSRYAQAKAIGVELNRLKETELYAGLVFDDIRLRAWLGPLIRGGGPHGRRDRPS